MRQAGEKWRAGGVWLCYVAYVTFFTDVNVAFQQSAHKVLLDDDNLLPLLHLTIEYHGKEQKDAAQGREGPSRETSPREAPASGWAALGLSYKVQWPLHILFTPAVLEK